MCIYVHTSSMYMYIYVYMYIYRPCCPYSPRPNDSTQPVVSSTKECADPHSNRYVAVSCRVLQCDVVSHSVL